MITLTLDQLTSRGIGSGLLPETEILIEKFTLTSLTMCNESVETKNYQTFIDAVSEHVSVDINVLSIRDFFQIVAAIRCITFPASPITMSWNCVGVMFKYGEVLSSPADLMDMLSQNPEENPDNWLPIECGTDNIHTLEFADLESKQLPTEIDLDPRLDIPRVGLLSEYRKLCAEPRYSRIVPAVAWLKAGETIEDKLRILHNDMDLYDVCSQAAAKYPHGLVSSTSSVCTCCGTEVKQPLYIDNTSFLRNLS